MRFSSNSTLIFNSLTISSISTNKLKADYLGVGGHLVHGHDTSLDLFFRVAVPHPIKGPVFKRYVNKWQDCGHELLLFRWRDS